MMTIKKTYTKPEIEVLEMAPEAAIMQFGSGWRNDGNKEGDVEPSGKPGFSEDNEDWGLNE